MCASLKIAERNQWAGQHPRSKLETGLRQLEAWAQRHKLDELVELQQEGDRLQMKPKPEAIDRSLELAGCYVLTSDVTPAKLEAAQVHESYMALEKVERDFRAMKTGLLEVRPIFVRKEGRTRGHVFCCMLALKLTREMERRLRAAFGTTETNPDAITLPDALVALSRLCLLHWPVDGENIVTKLPLPDQGQQEILAALRVHLPGMGM
jgi:transposase